MGRANLNFYRHSSGKATDRAAISTLHSFTQCPETPRPPAGGVLPSQEPGQAAQRVGMAQEPMPRRHRGILRAGTVQPLQSILFAKTLQGKPIGTGARPVLLPEQRGFRESPFYNELLCPSYQKHRHNRASSILPGSRFRPSLCPAVLCGARLRAVSKQ